MSSGKFGATLTEVMTSWSMVDLWEANAILTAFEAAEAEAAERARQ